MKSRKNDLSKGERLARKINFDRDAWVTTTPGVSGDILPAEEQREDFIKDINKHGEQFEYCTVCRSSHIPPGPPITLADRDTCGSLLPKWFPAHLLTRPWDTYRQLINELVALDEKAQEERERAQDPDPSKPRWDLEWHESDAEWVAAGRREGWWRCRSGPEAPPVERNCRVCHHHHHRDGDGEEQTTLLTVGEEDEMRQERRRLLQGFIDQQVRVFGEMDKQIALAKGQLEGMGLLDTKLSSPSSSSALSPSGMMTAAMAREMEEAVAGGSGSKGFERDGGAEEGRGGS